MPTFTTELVSSGATKMGIIVPDEVVAALGKGKRPPVTVTINGYSYRSTVAVMGGKYMIGISAAVRKETGLSRGDPIHVTLTVATAPREVNVPDDLAFALSADPALKTFFEKLPNSLQRYHVDKINGAKSAETRQRRIENAVSLFARGKQR